MVSRRLLYLDSGKYRNVHSGVELSESVTKLEDGVAAQTGSVVFIGFHKLGAGGAGA